MPFPEDGDSAAASTRLSTDNDSYGSDWGEDGEALLADLLRDAELLQGESPMVVTDLYEHALDHFAVVPLRVQTSSNLSQPTPQVPLQHPDNVAHDESRGKIRFERAETNASVDRDTRSPLTRFRTAPKKPLSVTDLVSPAWCELQYLYNLEKFGKKLQTPAMQRGSSVHKVLEEQVHQVIPIDVQTREDHWGLRIWNVVQGLRTLRNTGITRELEVWGTIGDDRLVVNGVIDELSYTSTDPDLEAALDKDGAKSPGIVPPDQKTISEFFASQHGAILQPTLKEHFAGPLRSTTPSSKVFLTDVKTRNHQSLPKGASLRPTHIQLMLYRRLLSDLACNKVDSTRVFERYRVNPALPFSDSLIAQLGSLHFDSTGETDQHSASPESQSDAISELLTHNSLESLWTLMIEEFQKTFPLGDASLGKVLKVEFRGSHDGEVIGSKTFPNSNKDIDAYVQKELDWWQGRREAEGVEIEEAFKCRICEHAETCSWRINKIQEATDSARRRKSLRKPP